MKKFLATTLFAAILLSCSLSVNAAGIKDIFSANYYADSYEDLYAAFEYDEAKLLKHVKEYGLKEGRDVSPILDVVFYRETYPDLDAAFGDNWDAYVKHYFEYGIKEGRDNGTNFDIIRYVNSYADLREAFDEDYEALAKHYIKYGMKENRTLGLKPQVAPAKTTVQPIVYYEEVIYDDEGRVEKVEVYSDSSKTTLVSYQEYEYYEGNAYAIYEYNAQGDMTKAALYDGNGIMRSEVIAEDIDEELGVVISGKMRNYYEDGSIMYERVVRDQILVKETSYYQNGIVEEHYEYDPETEEVISGYGYHESGQLWFQIGYDERGYRYHKEWYANGVMSYQDGYDENGFDFVKEWDERGTLRYHSGHDENGYFTKEWDENGNLLTESRGE